MLANNICDVEDDIENKRYTLPVLVGRKKASVLLKALFYFSYVAIAVGVIFGYLPLYSLLVLITLIPVQKKIQAFVAAPTKKDTFGLVISNFLLINVSLALSLFLGAALPLPI